MEAFAWKGDKRARLSKTGGPKSHVCYGIHSRSAGQTAGQPVREFKNTPFQQLTCYASAKKREARVVRESILTSEAKNAFFASGKIFSVVSMGIFGRIPDF